MPINLPFGRRAGGRPDSQPQPAGGKSDVKNVLLIDDEPLILMTVKQLLLGRRESWTIRTTTDGHEGLQILAEQPFDAVVCDMSLAGLHGLTVLAKVMENHPEVTRIALTAYTDEQWKVENKASVAHAIVRKPCTTAELIRAIERPQNIGCPAAARFGASTTVNAVSEPTRHTYWDDDEVVTFS